MLYKNYFYENRKFKKTFVHDLAEMRTCAHQITAILHIFVSDGNAGSRTLNKST